MSVITLRSVNNRYHYIGHLEEEVLVCNDDNFINISKIVNEDDLDAWFRFDSSEILINRVTGMISELSYYMILDGPDELQGTYIHPLLASPILYWCSPILYLRFNPLIIKVSEDRVLMLNARR